MPAFTWAKAAPGLYYLWDDVPGQNRRANVGKVWRINAQDYGARFYCGPHHLEFRGHSTPKSRMWHLQEAIRRILPDATFSAENFNLS